MEKADRKKKERKLKNKSLNARKRERKKEKYRPAFRRQQGPAKFFFKGWVKRGWGEMQLWRRAFFGFFSRNLGYF